MTDLRITKIDRVAHLNALDRIAKRACDALPETHDHAGVASILAAAPFLDHVRLGPIAMLDGEEIEDAHASRLVCTLDALTSHVYEGQDETADGFRRELRAELRRLARDPSRRHVPIVEIRVYSYQGEPLESWKQDARDVFDRRSTCEFCGEEAVKGCEACLDGFMPEC